MSKPIIYLHVGSEKTGSTALQIFLSRNFQLIRKYGLLYPNAPASVLPQYWHHSLIAAILSPHNTKGLIGDQERSRWTVDLVRKTLLDEIAKGNSLILSSEHFSSRLKRQELEFFAALGVSVRIICYVRRQDQYIQSRYSTALKCGSRASIKQFTEIQLKQNITDIYKLLLPFKAIFGVENVIVRPYEKQQFYRNNIYADFIHTTLGADLSDGGFCLPHNNINSSFSRDVIEYKKLLNYLPGFDHENDALNSCLHRYSVQECKTDTGPSSKHNLLSPDETLAILERYSKSNRQVAQEYLGRKNGQLFYDPVPGINQLWQPYPGLSDSKIIGISSFLKEKRPKLFRSLAKTVHENINAEDDDLSRTARLLEPAFKEVSSNL